jgi:hypothetical protein
MALAARGGPLRAISFRLIAYPGHSRKSKGNRNIQALPNGCQPCQVASGLPERGFFDAKGDGIAATLQIIKVTV